MTRRTLRTSRTDARRPVRLLRGHRGAAEGSRRAVRAFAELAREDRDVELWLAGQAGWGTGPIEDSDSRRIPSAARIRRLGFVDDARPPGALSSGTRGGLPLAGRGLRSARPRGDGLWRVGGDDRGTVMAEVARARPRRWCPSATARRARDGSRSRRLDEAPTTNVCAIARARSTTRRALHVGRLPRSTPGGLRTGPGV